MSDTNSLEREEAKSRNQNVRIRKIKIVQPVDLGQKVKQEYITPQIILKPEYITPGGAGDLFP